MTQQKCVDENVLKKELQYNIRLVAFDSKCISLDSAADRASTRTIGLVPQAAHQGRILRTST